VSQSPCPVITIRGSLNIARDLARIVLPIDSTLETRQKVPFTALMAKLFDAEVHVVLTFTTKVASIRRQIEEYAQQTIKYLQKADVKYKVEYLEVKNMVDDILNYSKTVDANLISIMTEMEKSTWNLWLGSYAQQLVNHSPIPVLTIHAKDVMTSTSTF
jgi:nucleotide-binding universal stress UspA family protein